MAARLSRDYRTRCPVLAEHWLQNTHVGFDAFVCIRPRYDVGGRRRVAIRFFKSRRLLCLIHFVLLPTSYYTAKYAVLSFRVPFIHTQVKCVDIRFPLPTPLDGNVFTLFQFLDGRVRMPFADTHIPSERLLPRKTLVVLPGIFQKHDVRELRTGRQLSAVKHHIRDEREAVLCKNIRAV